MVKRLALSVAVVAVLLAAFVWGYMPVRARRLSAKYAAFRAGFEAQHQAIDAAFHQQDRVVNGVRWCPAAGGSQVPAHRHRYERLRPFRPRGPTMSGIALRGRPTT
jgi:type II secretory pathway pseudopilin PulG